MLLISVNQEIAFCDLPISAVEMCYVLAFGPERPFIYVFLFSYFMLFLFLFYSPMYMYI